MTLYDYISMSVDYCNRIQSLEELNLTFQKLDGYFATVSNGIKVEKRVICNFEKFGVSCATVLKV